MKTPQFFELRWEWYEYLNYYLFTHPEKSQEDFKQDVKSLLIKYGNDYLANEKSWAGVNEWVDFVAKKMPELGYQPIQPVTESFFGAHIIDGDDEDNNAWGKVVGDGLLRKAIKHNNRIRKKIDIK